MSLPSNSVSSLVRPPNRTYNSWDELRFSQRNVPTIETVAEIPLDTFESAPSIEAQAGSPVHVDESNPTTPNIIYRLGWRSFLQIWAALATTTTFCIASANLYNRLHPKGPPET